MIEVTINLDEELLKFLDQQAQGDRSQYINALLASQRHRDLELLMRQSLQEDAQDLAYQEEGFRFKAGQKRRRRTAPSSFLSRLKLVPKKK
jgi:hypothetical protein